MGAPVNAMAKAATRIPLKVMKTATKVPQKMLGAAADAVETKPETVEKIVTRDVARPPEPRAVVRVGGGGDAQAGRAGRARSSRGQKYRPVLTGPGGVAEPAKTKKKHLLGA